MKPCNSSRLEHCRPSGLRPISWEEKIRPPISRDLPATVSTSTTTIGLREGGGAILAVGTVASESAGRIKIINNTFTGNRAGIGTAVAIGNADATVSHNVFDGNFVAGSGVPATPGGVLAIVADDQQNTGDVNDLVGMTITAGADVDMDVQVVNNLIVDNLYGLLASPAAVWVVTGDEDTRDLECNVTFVNNTSSGNSVPSISFHEGTGSVLTSAIQNCILWDSNTTIETSGAPSYNIFYSDVQDPALVLSTFGTGNISSAPLFVSATDYHLTSTSPCIDTGFNTYFSNARLVDTQIPNTDLDGNRRFNPGPGGSTKIIDMGCYEFATP